MLDSSPVALGKPMIIFILGVLVYASIIAYHIIFFEFQRKMCFL
jgi:hypothetical protein